MEWFLTSNTAKARLLRTIVQGILALLPEIFNYYLAYMPEWCGIILVPVLMCIISPCMAELGKAIKEHGGSFDEKIGGSE